MKTGLVTRYLVICLFCVKKGFKIGTGYILVPLMPKRGRRESPLFIPYLVQKNTKQPPLQPFLILEDTTRFKLCYDNPFDIYFIPFQPTYSKVTFLYFLKSSGKIRAGGLGRSWIGGLKDDKCLGLLGPTIAIVFSLPRAPCGRLYPHSATYTTITSQIRDTGVYCGTQGRNYSLDGLNKHVSASITPGQVKPTFRYVK